MYNYNKKNSKKSVLYSVGYFLVLILVIGPVVGVFALLYWFAGVLLSILLLLVPYVELTMTQEIVATVSILMGMLKFLNSITIKVKG